jgi:hypothetical protein
MGDRRGDRGFFTGGKGRVERFSGWVEEVFYRREGR